MQQSLATHLKENFLALTFYCSKFMETICLKRDSQEYEVNLLRMIILDNKLFDHELLGKKSDLWSLESNCSIGGTVTGQYSGANIGPGYAYRNYLQSKALWIENAMTLNLDRKRVPFFFPKGKLFSF